MARVESITEQAGRVKKKRDRGKITCVRYGTEINIATMHSIPLQGRARNLNAQCTAQQASTGGSQACVTAHTREATYSEKRRCQQIGIRTEPHIQRLLMPADLRISFPQLRGH